VLVAAPEENGVSRGADPHQVSDAVVHRALASPTRARLVELLRDSGDEMGVRALADAIGLHPNTVRGHLGILENAGLVTCSTAVSAGPGRPRHVYRAVREREARSDEDDERYRLLASLLAERVRSERPQAPSAVEHAAVTWGRHLVGRADGELTPERAVARLVELLGRLGFDAKVEGDLLEGNLAEGFALRIGDCPFSDVARTHPEIACAVHRGLTTGLLQALGGSIELVHMVADPESRRCQATLQVAT
jgi:predicted ArsR family transcriptional regulator